MSDLDGLTRSGPWDGVRVVVAGFGRAGFSAADNLLHLGATVTALDEPLNDDDPLEADRSEKAELLTVLGATITLAAGATDELPECDLLVASPELPDDAPLLAAARERGVPVWGEVELAWRLRDPQAAAPWLVVAGSAGLGDVAGRVERILVAAGRRPVVAGASGLPLVEAVMDPEPWDAVVVALEDQQLRHLSSMSALASVVLDGGEAARAAAYEHVQEVCVYVVADESTRVLVEEADVVDGARAVGITLGTPSVGMLGVVEDLLVERAFLAQRSTSAAELLSLADLGTEDPVEVTRALAAAALALAAGVAPVAVRDGLRASV